MAIQIPNHGHCSICQRAVPFGDKTCSPRCQADLDELQRKRKRTMLLMYGLMALSVVVLILTVASPGLVGG